MKTKRPADTATPNASPADAARGKAAYDKLLPRLRALHANDLTHINVDVGSAALVALGVSGRVTQPALHARFEHLAGPEFSIAHVDDLADVAWAAHYAAELADKLRAASSDAQLPASLVTHATAIEKRLQDCCEYYFSDDETLGPEIARLRPGTGYRDLAGDLLGYAAIYEQKKDVIEHDTKNYRATDHADAIAAAEEILKLLAAAMTPEARAAANDLARAWTLLGQDYGEVRAAGLFIERADPTAPERYPTLVAATRVPATRAKKPATPAAPPATSPNK